MFHTSSPKRNLYTFLETPERNEPQRNPITFLRIYVYSRLNAIRFSVILWLIATDSLHFTTILHTK